MSMSEVSGELHEDEPATPTKLVDTSCPLAAEEEPNSDSLPELPLPRWLFSLIGYVLASLLGLVLGYLILAWLRPLTFPLPWYH